LEVRVQRNGTFLPIALIQLAMLVISQMIVVNSTFCEPHDAGDVYWSDCFIGNGLSEYYRML
jgi:hypothetical protein